MLPEDGSVVDPVRLRAAAETIDQAAQPLTGAYQSAADSLVPAASGWAAAGAAETAAVAWATFASDLGAGIAACADGTRCAAASYTTADARAARLINKAT
ncbi:MAG: hypothetical protein JXA67_10635 [Micromonosporaceae bacterium]|nr:hypothetical protein [Micromonosporaceae bacterium]